MSGKGTHGGKSWQLEMGRKFSSGPPEEGAVVDPRKDNRRAVSVLDDELSEEHSVSTKIVLRFRRGR